MREASKEFDGKKISCCAIFFFADWFVGGARFFVQVTHLQDFLKRNCFRGTLNWLSAGMKMRNVLKAFDLINASCIP